MERDVICTVHITSSTRYSCQQMSLAAAGPTCKNQKAMRRITAIRYCWVNTVPYTIVVVVVMLLITDRGVVFLQYVHMHAAMVGAFRETCV